MPLQEELASSLQGMDYVYSRTGQAGCPDSHREVSHTEPGISLRQRPVEGRTKLARSPVKQRSMVYQPSASQLPAHVPQAEPEP